MNNHFLTLVSEARVRRQVMSTIGVIRDNVIVRRRVASTH